MADEIIRKPGRDIGLIFLVLIILGVIWFVQGGPQQGAPRSPFLDVEQTKSGSFEISESDKTDFFENSGTAEKVSSNASDKGKISLYTRNARNTDPQKEYIEIGASKSNQQGLDITGWIIKGQQGLDLKLPQAANLFISNQVNAESDIILSPGDKAIIITDKSPLGQSFRLNKCTGYFSQNREFEPYLPQECPYPKDEQWPASLKPQCRSYIDTLARCRANFTIPFGLDDQCVTSINKILSYNSCVEAHKNDADFYKPEWRIYLNRSAELWRDKWENIIVQDKEGNIVGSVAY